MVLICGQTEAAMTADHHTSVTKKRATEHCCCGKCTSQMNLYNPIFKAREDKRYNDGVGKGQEKRKTEKCRKWFMHVDEKVVQLL